MPLAVVSPCGAAPHLAAHACCAPRSGSAMFYYSCASTEHRNATQEPSAMEKQSTERIRGDHFRVICMDAHAAPRSDVIV